MYRGDKKIIKMSPDKTSRSLQDSKIIIWNHFFSFPKKDYILTIYCMSLTFLQIANKFKPKNVVKKTRFVKGFHLLDQVFQGP